MPSAVRISICSSIMAPALRGEDTGSRSWRLPGLPAEGGLVVRPDLPGGPVERGGLEARHHLRAHLLGGREQVGGRGTARLRQEGIEVERALPFPLRALDVEEDGVRREPPSLQRSQSLPETRALYTQGAVLSPQEALHRLGGRRQLQGEAGREGVIDQMGDLAGRV